ncbi:MAG: hypothetical protein GC149_01875 [Gammaproteobacteria bacterium]|nr:hypothetical protein [Gammaproteobacteria bacterium]
MTSSSASKSKQDRPQLWLYVTIAILLIPLAVTVYLSMSDSDIGVTAPLNVSCDLHHGPCQSVFPNGAKVSLSIEPRPIAALKPLQIRVQTEGIEAKSVAVDFRGVDMNMGYNRPQLRQVAPGQYTGTWVLASCGLERMIWEATVIIETARTKMAAPFRLETSGKSAREQKQ